MLEILCVMINIGNLTGPGWPRRQTSVHVCVSARELLGWLGWAGRLSFRCRQLHPMEGESEVSASTHCSAPWLQMQSDSHLTLLLPGLPWQDKLLLNYDPEQTLSWSPALVRHLLAAITKEVVHNTSCPSASNTWARCSSWHKHKETQPPHKQIHLHL